VQFGQIAAKARPCQHRTDDYVPQRVSDEAVRMRQTTFRERNLQLEWAAGEKKKKKSASNAADPRHRAVARYRNRNWFQQRLFRDSCYNIWYDYR